MGIVIWTGTFPEISAGYEGRIKPGIGIAIKTVVKGLKSFGRIGAGYQCEVCVIPVNLTDENFVIEERSGKCRMVTAKH